MDRYRKLDGLVGLARQKGVDIAPTLLRVLTDLYVQNSRHTAEEERHYSELALRLIDIVDMPTRQVVAARLAAHTSAPKDVVQRLEAAGASVTALPPTNPVVMTPDLSVLFFEANTEERRLIMLNLDFAPITPAAAPSAVEASAAIERIEKAALSRNIREVSRIVAQVLHLSPRQAAQIVADRTGEPVLIAAKALAMRSDVLQRIILFLNPAVGESVQQVYELACLYDDISTDAALKMLSLWRSSTTPTAKPAHQPLLWDDENARARAVMSPAPRRVETRPLPRYDRRTTRQGPRN